MHNTTRPEARIWVVRWMAAPDCLLLGRLIGLKTGVLFMENFI
jgi:hypothetical protein